MNKHTDTITDLGLKTDIEGKPTIRTADGRTLRRKCPNKAKDARIYSKTAESFCEVLGDNCLCDGRGWLPVSEDTAVVVCLEWLQMVLWPPMKGKDWAVQLSREFVEGETLPAAVFAAARKVVSNGKE